MRIEDLEILASRFEQEKESLRCTLNELAGDGSGILYEIKMLIGMETDLGAAIGRCENSISNASVYAINHLTDVYERMTDSITKYKEVNEEAINSFKAATERIQVIDFN